MRSRIASRIAPFLPAFLALGCGGVKPTGTTTTPPNPYNFSGDWGVVAVLGGATQPLIEGFAGTLSASNGVITGGLVPLPSAFTGMDCIAPTLTPVPVSGTIDSTGNLTITLSVAGGTATLTAALSTSFETQAAGSFKIVGGTCATATTPMKIAQYAPLNGTYTGTLFTTILPTGVQSNSLTTATAVLTQSATTNSSGLYPVTGTVTLSGACVATFTLSNAFVLGGILEGPDTSGNYFFGGGADPTASSLESALTIQNSSPGCPLNSQDFLSGTLTRQ